MSVLTHILLFFSREEIGDEEVAYSTASGLALSAVSAVTTGLLVYGVIQVIINIFRCKAGKFLSF